VAVQQQVLGRLAASERSLQDCLSLCDEPARRSDALKAHQYLALLRAYQGMVEDAMNELVSAESLLQGSEQPGVPSALSAYRTLCALLAGDLDMAVAAAVRARELGGRSADVRDAIRATWLWGRVMTALGARERSRGHLDEAGRSLDGALQMCRKNGVVDYEADLLLAAASLSLVDGEMEAADRLGREALAIAERSSFRVLEADIHNLLAEAARRAGRGREALAHARRALACAECDGAPYCYRPALEIARAHLAAAAL
jgi:tetratricopeptide (TPR) repeat protein